MRSEVCAGFDFGFLFLSLSQKWQPPGDVDGALGELQYSSLRRILSWNFRVPVPGAPFGAFSDRFWGSFRSIVGRVWC